MGNIDRLGTIKKFFRKHHRLPSYSEMLHLFNISSKNAIFKIINKWIEEGFFKKEGHKLAPTTKFFAIPLIGNIRAGFPILAEENRDYVSLDDYLIEDPQSSFLLKVSGDSLEGIGIFEGDIVIIQRKKEASIGSGVLAQIYKERTFKILRKDRIQRLDRKSSCRERV